MNLEEAINLLKRAVKSSTALDEFKHIDLSLFSAKDQILAQQALMIVQKAIRSEDNDFTQELFEKKVGIKSA